MRARLEDLYKKRFPGAFEIITDSKPISEDELDSKTAFLQLTSVEPYCAKTPNFSTDFSQNHNLSTFSFETPFTKDGKARTDDVTKQWIRKTIISTKHAFPYCTKRIQVDSEDQIVLSFWVSKIIIIAKIQFSDTAVFFHVKLFHQTAKILIQWNFYGKDNFRKS